MERRTFLSAVLACIPGLPLLLRRNELARMKRLPWGTYGKNHEHPLKWITLGEASTEHLEAILRTQFHITKEYRVAIQSILQERAQCLPG